MVVSNRSLFKDVVVDDSGGSQKVHRVTETHSNGHVAPMNQDVQRSGEKRKRASQPPQLRVSDDIEPPTQALSIPPNASQTPASPRRDAKITRSTGYWDARKTLEISHKQLPPPWRLSAEAHDNMLQTMQKGDGTVMAGREDSGSVPAYGLRFKVDCKNIWGHFETEEFWLRLDGGVIERYRSWADYRRAIDNPKDNNHAQSLISETNLWRYPPDDLLAAAYIGLWDYTQRLREAFTKKVTENELLVKQISARQRLPSTPLFMVEDVRNSYFEVERQLKESQKTIEELRKKINEKDPQASEGEVVEFLLRKMKTTGQAQALPGEQQGLEVTSVTVSKSHEEHMAALRDQLAKAHEREAEQKAHSRYLKEALELEQQQLGEASLLIQQFQEAINSRELYIVDLKHFCEEQVKLVQRQDDRAVDLQSKLEILKTKHDEMNNAYRETYFWVRAIEQLQNNEQNQMQLQYEKDKTELFYEMQRNLRYSGTDAMAEIQKKEENALRSDKTQAMRRAKPKALNSTSQPMHKLPENRRSPEGLNAHYESKTSIQRLSPASVRAINMASQLDTPGDRCPCNISLPYTGTALVRQSCEGIPGHFRLFKGDFVEIAHWDISRQGMYCVRHKKTAWQGFVDASNLRIADIPVPLEFSEYYGPDFDSPMSSAFTSRLTGLPKVEVKIHHAWDQMPVQDDRYIEYQDHAKLQWPWKDVLPRNPIGPGFSRGRVRSKSEAMLGTHPGRVVKYGAHVDLIPHRTVADCEVDDRSCMSEPVTHIARSRARRSSMPPLLRNPEPDFAADLDFLLSSAAWYNWNPFSRSWNEGGSRKRPGYLDEAGLRLMAQIAHGARTSDNETSSSDPDVEALLEICKDQTWGYELFYEVTSEWSSSEASANLAQSDRFVVSQKEDITSPGGSRITVRCIAEADLRVALPSTSLCYVQPKLLAWWEPRLRSAVIAKTLDNPDDTIQVVLVRRSIDEPNKSYQCLVNGALVDLPTAELKVEDARHWPLLIDILDDLQMAEKQLTQQLLRSTEPELMQQALNTEPIDLRIPTLHEYDLLFPVIQQHIAKNPFFLTVGTRDHVILTPNQGAKPADTVRCNILGVNNDISGLVPKDVVDLMAPGLPIYIFSEELGIEGGNWAVVLQRRGDKICCCLPDQHIMWFYAYKLPLDLDSVGYHSLTWLWENDILPREGGSSNTQPTSHPGSIRGSDAEDFTPSSSHQPIESHASNKLQGLTPDSDLSPHARSEQPIEVGNNTPSTEMSSEKPTERYQESSDEQPIDSAVIYPAKRANEYADESRPKTVEASSNDHRLSEQPKASIDEQDRPQSPYVNKSDSSVDEPLPNSKSQSVKDGSTESQLMVPYDNYREQKEVQQTRSNPRAGPDSSSTNTMNPKVVTQQPQLKAQRQSFVNNAIAALSGQSSSAFSSSSSSSIFFTVCHLLYWTALAWLFLGILAAQQGWLDVNGVGVVKGLQLIRGQRAAENGGWEWAIWEAVKLRLG